MTVATLLETLHQHSIDLWVEGDRLRYRAPKGRMTPALRQELRRHKHALIAALGHTQQPQPGSAPADVPPAIRPVPHTSPLPLSFTQQRLWFLAQLQPHSPAYNILSTLQLTGHLHLHALEASINTVIERHAILRTSIQVSDGHPRQVIAPGLRLTLTTCDMQSLTPEQRDAETRRMVVAEAQHPFDMTRLPLLRVTLLQHAVDQHILVLTTHHMVADGWSLSILLHELLALYYTHVTTPHTPGAGADLPPLALQFADYAVWQRESFQHSLFAEQMTYWQRQLAEAPELLALPTDHPRPAVQTFRGATWPVTFARPLTEALKALSRSEHVTLFMTLLAAFQTLLARYTQQDDIIVATAVSHRPHRELEGVIGPFSNNLLLRTDLSDKPTFQTLLSRVRQVVIDAFAHQDLPFERLVEALQPQRNLSHNPLFQVMFLLQNAPTPGGSSGYGSQCQCTDIHTLHAAPCPLTFLTGVTRFDLTLMLYETPTGLEGCVEYSSDLFEATTIARLVDHFGVLLEGIVANPHQPVATLPLLTTAEHQQMLVDWNATAAPYPDTACIHHLFETQAAQTPHATALLSAEQHLTYQALNQRANMVAHHLQTLGVGRGVLVGICLGRSFDFVIALLGILKAGAAYVPLDPHAPPARLAFLLQDTRMPVLVSRGDVVSRLPHHPVQVVCLETFVSGADATDATDWSYQPSDVTPDDLAYVIYTSGSTGQPKGVMIRHRSVCNLAYAHRRAFGVEPASRVLQCAAVSFDGAVTEIFTTLLSGATLDLGMPDHPRAGRDMLRLLCRRAITHAILPPSILASLPVEPLPHLQTLVVAGEACSAELVQRWAEGRRFFNGYGPTEATVCTTLSLCQSDGKPPPIGRPIQNMQVYILDAARQPVPIGVAGELCIGGVGLAVGYLNRPDLNAERFIAHPFSTQPGARLYRTGDQARYRPDGTIEFLGRLDHQVKLRGFRVEPGEIEAALRKHPHVCEAVVMLRNDRGDPRLVAYLVPSVQTGEVPLPDWQHWRSFLQETLPDYMVPSAYVTLASLPLTPHGKVDRHRLPLPAAPRVMPAEQSAGPRDQLEADLLRIWEAVLGTHPVGVTDNFFDVGGHSLLAVRLLDQLRRYSGQDIPLTTLFLGGSVAEVARLLRSGADTLPWSPLVPMQPHGTKPPFFCVHPLLGVVFPYAHLAHHLGTEQPFYGLQAAGLHPHQQPHTSVSEMATHYLQAIQKVQPHGPYSLGGWSFGSVVAFEMAQQLHQQGETVALLALFDTPAPGVLPASAGLLIFLLTSLRFIWPYLADYLALALQAPGQQHGPVSRLLHSLVQRMPTARWLHPHRQQLVTHHATIRRMVRLLAMNVQVATAYTPHPYPHPVTLFRTRASQHDSANGWQQFVTGSVTVHTVPGNHYSMLRPPHVHVLAEHLRRCLEYAF